ncbi:glycosyltransferase [Sinomonas sp. ASV322]|uniref:glycosyltransferase family 2 protein n=1 Tax=Sinomonas sp. ASV322 TaxID=3041920 RepID=UPI0027DE08F3|nr:glycosyltransferase [Sinomonas sp. ASV322]MDQ4501363.1 glycosyltransferase [Sinomonas sp. ASV322]
MADVQASVIIPARNAARTLGIQLEALLAQKGAPQYEVLVVDNASTDGTPEVVRAFSSRFRAHDLAELRLVSAPAHRSASYSRNVGVRFSRAQKLLFCDGDDCVSAHWVRHGAELLEHCEVYSGTALSLKDKLFPDDIAKVRQWLGDDFELCPLEDAQRDAPFPVLMGGNFGIRKSCMLELGGFDHSMGSAGEDNELALRIRSSGRPVLTTGSARLAYRDRTSPRGIFRAARAGGKAHVLNALRYGLWSASPVVGHGRWIGGVVHAFAAAGKMLVLPRSRDFEGISGRLGTAIGAFEGVVIYRILGRTGRPMLGVGFSGSNEYEVDLA